MPTSIRWKSSCRSCSGCCPISRSCRSSSATRPAAMVADVLDALWGGPETLIVVSSDLSHYHAVPRCAGGSTARPPTRILALASGLDHEQACGATPINGLLLAAPPARLAAELLDLRNSGDTAGDRAGVVGYAAFGFTRSEAPMAPTELGTRAAAHRARRARPALRRGHRRSPASRRARRARRDVRHADASTASCAAASARWKRTGRCWRRRRGQHAGRRLSRSALRAARGARARRSRAIEVSLLSAPAPLPIAGEDDLLRAAAPRRRRRGARLARTAGDFPAAGLGHARRAARLHRRAEATRPGSRRASGPTTFACRATPSPSSGNRKRIVRCFQS